MVTLRRITTISLAWMLGLGVTVPAMGAQQSSSQRMIQDHTKASQEVNKLLSTLGMASPNDIPKGTTQPKGKFSSLSGAAFDRAYIRHQIADHKKNVSEFAATSKTLKNSQVREWAFATLPVLKEHFSLAKGLASKRARPLAK